MSDTRQHAHELIDSLPETQLSGLVRFLETIVDPVAVALHTAQIDDEPESEAEKAAVAEARTSGTVPHDEALRRLGLK